MTHNLFTTGEVGSILNQPTWRIRNILNEKSFPQCGRFAGKRAVPGTLIPLIAERLRERGFLKEQGVENV